MKNDAVCRQLVFCRRCPLPSSNPSLSSLNLFTAEDWNLGLDKMWFEYSSNESMLMMDKKISLVATPEGTPSPPELTSTVARPMLQRKVFADKFVKEDVDGSFIQRPTSKKIQFSEDVNESVST